MMNYNIYFSKKQKVAVAGSWGRKGCHDREIKIDGKWVEYTEMCRVGHGKCNWDDAVFLGQSDGMGSRAIVKEAPDA